MAAGVPSRRWRRCCAVLRGIRVTLLLLIFFLVAFFVYLNEVGLPGFLKTPLIEKLRVRGVDLEFTRLRLHWNRGMVAENVRFGRANQETNGPQFTFKEVELKLNHSALLKFQLNVDALILHNGSFVWPLEETNQPPLALSVTNIQTQLRFLPGDQWELDNFMAAFAGARLQLSGSLTNASAVRDWRIFQGRGETQPELIRERLRKFVKTVEGIKFAGQPPGLEVILRGDARDMESLNGLLTLNTPGAETPWGTLTNGAFIARMSATGSAHPQPHAEFELRAGGATTPWAESTNFQLRLNIVRDDAATNLIHARLDVSAGQSTTRWAGAAGAHFTAEWVHSLTNAVPLSGTGDLRLADVSNRWGELGELHLEGRLSAPPTNEPPQSDDQWAWWARLKPYFIDWNCQLKNIHAEDNAQKFDLQELDCAGLWRAPELAVTNLHAAMYQGHLNVHASVNVATRALAFGGTSDFDAQKISPFLTEGGRHWIQQFSWDKPPFAEGDGSLVLPAWTNRQPDWRGEVLPTLSLQGDFKADNAAFREVPVISAHSHFSFTNMAWNLPDLVAVRPEGTIELVHMSDELTKRFYFRVHSTIDVMAARPLLETNTQHGLDLLQFTNPPVIDAEIWGRWHEPEETGGRAHVVLSNFTFRGESATFFRADLQYTNRFLDVINARVENGSRFMTASNATVDIAGRRIFLTNGFSTMDPGAVTRAIGSKVAGVMEPYHFLAPPTASAYGTIPLADGIAADLHFKIDGGPFQWMKFYIDHIGGNVDWVGDHLTLSNVDASFYQGQLTAKAAFDFKHDDGTVFSFNTIFKDANLQTLIADLSSSSNQLEGRLSGNLEIDQANTRDPKSWSGRGHIDLRDGLIWDIPIFGIFSPMLDKISPGLGKSRANRASGAFDITNSIIRSDNLEIRSPAMRMQYRGAVEFNGKVDAIVEAELLRDTWLVGPVLSTILSPLSKLFEYKVTGTLKDPRTEPRFELPRVILMPFHLFRSSKDNSPASSTDTNAPPAIDPAPPTAPVPTTPPKSP